ncbi:sulfatase family protein [Flavitalea sp.]|nr:arylsulfatase [Flavitalea sp.]
MMKVFSDQKNMIRRKIPYALKKHCLVMMLAGVAMTAALPAIAQRKPNIVLVYTDDLGYGDLSCYGAKNINTPNIDRIAKSGTRFTNAHATSATCTPSRFSLLTGTYAWRKKGTGIAPGDAALIIPVDKVTMPSLLQKSGYTTAVVGKWHLGLGPKGGPDWNSEIRPGPLEIGFNYSFILPATVDRVPCIYVENHRVLNLDTSDPITVSYKVKIGNWPTGKENPELLKMKPSHGHDQTIVNGISRIGYMTGGKSALWTDEDISDVIISKSIKFINENKSKPFFLLVTTHDIHVPRVPHPRFAGKSNMGPRGDVILQLDDAIGTILNTLDRLKLTENTIFIFTSDNGPVVDDGYRDDAVEKLNGHKPAGPLRGGKYSSFDAGTRVPFIVSWPAKIKPGGISDVLFSHVDLLASLGKLTGQSLKKDEAPDSFEMSGTLTGEKPMERPFLVEHANSLSLIRGNWKYIEPSPGPALSKEVNIETGNNPAPQLYDLGNDIGEKNNLSTSKPALVKELSTLLQNIRDQKMNR